MNGVRPSSKKSCRISNNIKRARESGTEENGIFGGNRENKQWVQKKCFALVWIINNARKVSEFSSALLEFVIMIYYLGGEQREFSILGFTSASY